MFSATQSAAFQHSFLPRAPVHLSIGQ